MSTEEEAKKKSYEPMVNEEVILVPLYMGRRMAKLRVAKIP